MSMCTAVPSRGYDSHLTFRLPYRPLLIQFADITGTFRNSEMVIGSTFTYSASLIGGAEPVTQVKSLTVGTKGPGDIFSTYTKVSDLFKVPCGTPPTSGYNLSVTSTATDICGQSHTSGPFNTSAFAVIPGSRLFAQTQLLAIEATSGDLSGAECVNVVVKTNTRRGTTTVNTSPGEPHSLPMLCLARHAHC